ncbi:DUF2860 family protein [Aliarcobacter butzleri]|uniref:DUF2860 family protein n=1 Tax=Aliarcobacter butzleri TaxID=28197 RepID=A0AAW6VKK9_9BACT|nr:DUF2860 family protein [Aliarcobacter butzleri]MDK2042511.1 DUF2860 family protein [Aliarcobacter butzleri]MDK2097017.1 DUF2860 family protein [Aliarcobacter butzleri]
MKRILLPILLATVSFANEQNYIEIGGGIAKVKDNFSTESKKTIIQLNEAQNESESFPYYEMYYGYNLNDTLNLYVSSDIENGVHMGSLINSDLGVFDFGLKLNLSKEWKDSFKRGVNREKTDVTETGFYTGYGLSFIDNHEGMLQYEFSTIEYNKETIIDDLKREGNKHLFLFENKFNSKIFNNDLSYITNLSYEKYDAEGKSSSYDKYELLLGTTINLTKDFLFSIFSNIGKKNYEQINPILNTKINADIYGINTVLRCDKPFSYENIYLNIKTGYEKEEANHNFYNKENTYSILSIGYKF